jgi:hypothetical protein
MAINLNSVTGDTQINHFVMLNVCSIIFSHCGSGNAPHIFSSLELFFGSASCVQCLHSLCPEHESISNSARCPGDTLQSVERRPSRRYSTGVKLIKICHSARMQYRMGCTSEPSAASSATAAVVSCDDC